MKAEDVEVLFTYGDMPAIRIIAEHVADLNMINGNFEDPYMRKYLWNPLSSRLDVGYHPTMTWEQYTDWLMNDPQSLRVMVGFVGRLQSPYGRHQLPYGLKDDAEVLQQAMVPVWEPQRVKHAYPQELLQHAAVSLNDHASYSAMKHFNRANDMYAAAYGVYVAMQTPDTPLHRSEPSQLHFYNAGVENIIADPVGERVAVNFIRYVARKFRTDTPSEAMLTYEAGHVNGLMNSVEKFYEREWARKHRRPLQLKV